MNYYQKECLRKLKAHFRQELREIKMRTEPEKKILIEQDICPESPREWDNLGKMVCAHNNYTLGDETLISNPEANNWDEEILYYFTYLPEFNLPDSIKDDDDLLTEDGMREVEKWIDENIYYQNLSLHDHTSLHISLGLSTGWDSGQIGFIWVSRKQLEEEGITEERAYQIFQSELDTYNYYLSGECYMFHYTEDGEIVDSCAGFYGSDYKKNGMLDHFPPDWESIEIKYDYERG